MEIVDAGRGEKLWNGYYIGEEGARMDKGKA